MSEAANRLKKQLHYEKTFDCVQCGYCLPACPTYETMGKETHSPRGRINLVKMVAEGKSSVENMREPIEKCLGCRACQTVCPTNVQYGEILEGAKSVLEDHEKKTKKQQVTEDFIFNGLFPSRKWMNAIGNATWFYQKTGLQAIARKSGMTAMAPLHLDKFEAVLPKVASPFERRNSPRLVKAKRNPKMRVGFVSGCVMDSMFHQTNKNTIELLSRAGAEVVIPKAQTCCGALHAHTGKLEEARQLAKQNIEVFEKENVDYIVNNAGGCGAMLFEYDHLLKDEPDWNRRAEQFSKKSRDVTVVLTELDGLEFRHSMNERVTYQSSCHMTHVQKVTSEPLALLEGIPGITYREMAGYDRCCGSAGIYNIVNYEDSMEILDVKMEKTRRTKADTIVTTNPGCLLQMKLGIQRAGLEKEVRAVHLVDFLMEADPQPKESRK
ncbi:(Fe-S)-binding protein [Fictibacillus sp. S7]|uniref:(Fe-S)-binding protein n=1 Tax=Fictibacillus sp. S7 TaxID=2212476 RepID=UPI001013AC8E|nr:(Fe-S)-binding protein [Fictibacillus sp. S7]RXY99789.1 glycolate oxidase [Fictibacillus sp. S7]